MRNSIQKKINDFGFIFIGHSAIGHVTMRVFIFCDKYN